MTWLTHITLTTGDSRRSYREEVAQEGVDHVAGLLDGLLQGGTMEVRPGGDVVCRGQHMGKSLVATLYDKARDIPILTTGIALRSTAGAGLWRMLHETATTPLRTTADRAPPAPYIADRLEIGAELRLDAMMWTGDWARYLGWAWMDYAGRAR